MSPWWLGDGDEADAGFGDPTADAPQSAVVVLRTPENAIRNWFTDQGFAVEPGTGSTFAITGSRLLFVRTFGSADPSPAAEFDRNAVRALLDPELRPCLSAVRAHLSSAG